MRFTHAQRRRFADICADAGQVFLASIVLPFLVDKPNILLAIFGFASMLAFWSLSFLFTPTQS